MDTRSRPIAPAAAVLPASARSAPAWVWAFRGILYSSLLAACLLGGPVVQFAAAAGAIFALWGDLDGGFRHVLRIFGLGIAIWLAPTLGPPIAQFVSSRTSASPLMAGALGVGVAAFGVLVALHLVARGVTAGMRRCRPLDGMNRVLGGLVGASEGVVLVALVCWMLSAMQGPLAALRPRAAAGATSGGSAAEWILERVASANEAIQRDPAGRWLSERNPIHEVPALATMEELATVAASREAVESLSRDPRMRAFLETPAVKRHTDAVRHDESLRLALRNRDLLSVARSGTIAAMIGDPELVAALRGSWPELSAAVSDAGRVARSTAPRPQ